MKNIESNECHVDPQNENTTYRIDITDTVYADVNARFNEIKDELFQEDTCEI